ncbi:MAG: DUF475 domain-containing protein [Sulfurimonas sp.]|nr:DUF475 domain-containing protein [Sulfurimonadaceae bacterium]
MGHFRSSFIFSIIFLALAFTWGYSRGGISVALSVLALTIILSLMEISLSFDNAVVNASVLKTWDEWWRRLFLTLGMIVAVFGMRLVFPIVIVAHSADMGYLEVWNLAISSPDEYAARLTSHHAQISAFGGIFLLLVFLNFMLDDDKDIHWIKCVEKRLGFLGRIDAMSIFIAIITLIFFVSFIEDSKKLPVLMSGIWGIIVYVSVHIIGFALENKEQNLTSEVVKKGSIGGFLYLEILDASFSFDGVIGAFAITKDIVIIMIGLGIGAMFVRSITIYLVEKGTLDEFIYLEHGAHYAIGVLAFIMLIGMKVHVPEILTGLVGIVFIVLSLYSSKKHNSLLGK